MDNDNNVLIDIPYMILESVIGIILSGLENNYFVITIILSITIISIILTAFKVHGEKLYRSLKLPIRALLFITLITMYITILYFVFNQKTHTHKLIFICITTLLIATLYIIVSVKDPCITHMHRIMNDSSKYYQKYSRICKIKPYTPKENHIWKRNKAYLLCQMGDINSSQRIIDECNSKNDYQAFTIQGLINRAKLDVSAMGDSYNEAINIVENGNKHVRNDLIAQLYSNLGVKYRLGNDFLSATNYYSKASKYLTNKSEHSLINTVYGNLIISAAQSGADNNRINELLKEYNQKLNNNRTINDEVEYFNVKIDIARTNKNTSKIKETIRVGYDKIIMRMKENPTYYKDNTYLMFIASSLYLGLQNNLDLKPCLEEITNNIHYLNDIKNIDRYNFWNFIMESFYSKLINIQSRYYKKCTEILNMAEDYMQDKALGDLGEYKDEIATVPEAVNEQNTVEEMIIKVKHYLKIISFREAIKDRFEIIEDYKRHGNVEEEVRTLESIVNNGVAPENLNRYYEINNADLIKDATDKLTTILLNTKDNPSNYMAYYIAAYSNVLLGNYNNGMILYKKLLNTKITYEELNNEAKNNLFYVDVVYKVLKVNGLIEELKNDEFVSSSLSTEAKKWLDKYPEVPDIDIINLFGYFFDQNIIFYKTANWHELTSSGIQFPNSHSWLCLMGENGGKFLESLEIDIRLDKYIYEGSKIAFPPNGHPFTRKQINWKTENKIISDITINKKCKNLTYLSKTKENIINKRQDNKKSINRQMKNKLAPQEEIILLVAERLKSD